jgi:phosphoribosylamine--glycine ligase
MKVLVIGGGGREHSLVWKIAQSPLVKKIYCAPGNPGIARLAENVPIAANHIDALLKFALDHGIDLTVVGPEDPLVAGIVDRFKEKGLKIFGPTRAAARIEGSKVFAKNLMQRYGIPTAGYAVFTEAETAGEYLTKQQHYPVVLKASGLAAGKGVIICQDQTEAIRTITEIISGKIFGNAGDQVVIEDFLSGEEISIFVLTDGVSYRLLSSAQDHKKVFDDDLGKNTGGMGAYAPAPLADTDLVQQVEKTVIQPTLQAMQKEGCTYTGMLYVGLIITPGGPQVLEFNCRFGDPETEVVLPLLQSDLVPLLLATTDKTVDRETVDLHSGYAVDVVLASGGYPDIYEKGKMIKGLESVDPDILIFHAGTVFRDNNYFSSGGRVLNIVATGMDFMATRDHVYDNVQRIWFENMHYRRDIGYRAIKYFVPE